MPLTPDMRRDVDTIRNYLFGGGYPDPVSNAEQLSFLFFFYLVEGIDAENQRIVFSNTHFPSRWHPEHGTRGV